MEAPPYEPAECRTVGSTNRGNSSTQIIRSSHRNRDGSGEFREAPSVQSLPMRIFAYIVLLFLGPMALSQRAVNVT